MTDDVEMHAAAPDNTAECNGVGPVTEDMSKVNCPDCLERITPWIDGSADVFADRDDSDQEARMLFPSVFTLLESCGAALSARCFNGDRGCPVHPDLRATGGRSYAELQFPSVFGLLEA